jgi:hypothetical protein
VEAGGFVSERDVFSTPPFGDEFRGRRVVEAGGFVSERDVFSTPPFGDEFRGKPIEQFRI